MDETNICEVKVTSKLLMVHKLLAFILCPELFKHDIKHGYLLRLLSPASNEFDGIFDSLFHPLNKNADLVIFQ